VWRPELTPAAKVVPSPDAYFDPFVMLGMMAQRHKRIRLGTGVTEPLRRHPATLAQAFVTLDHLSGGRAILGIGNGERENTEPYGIPFTKRVARLEEALTIIRRLWSSGGEPVDFDGTFWTLRRALFATPLYRGRAPALWVAAHAPKMLGLTGRFADGWYPTIKMTGSDYRGRLDRIHAAAIGAGRDPKAFEPGAQIQVVLGTDRKTVLEELAASKVTGAMSMLMPGAAWKQHGLRHPLGDEVRGLPRVRPRGGDAAADRRRAPAGHAGAARRRHLRRHRRGDRARHRGPRAGGPPARHHLEPDAAHRRWVAVGALAARAARPSSKTHRAAA